MANNLNIDIEEVKKNGNVAKLKVEMGIEGMKKAILDIFYEGMNKDYSKYDAYFYLDEEGNPKFVVESL